MNVENYGSAWKIDPCYPPSKTDLSNEREMYKSTHWTSSRPLYCGENISRKAKNDNRLSLMQEVKAK